MTDALQAGLKTALVGFVTLWRTLYIQTRARDENGIPKTVITKEMTWQEIHSWLESKKGKKWLESKTENKDDGGRLAIITAARNKADGVITAGNTRPGRRRK